MFFHVFAQTTHVVAAPHGFACVVIPATRLNIPSFIEIRSGISEPRGVKIWPFPLLWLVAFTTACTTVQAVIILNSMLFLYTDNWCTQKVDQRRCNQTTRITFCFNSLQKTVYFNRRNRRSLQVYKFYYILTASSSTGIPVPVFTAELYRHAQITSSRSVDHIGSTFHQQR